MRTRNKKLKGAEVFRVSVTYDDTTPESAEHGDFENGLFGGRKMSKKGGQ